MRNKKERFKENQKNDENKMKKAKSINKKV